MNLWRVLFAFATFVNLAVGGAMMAAPSQIGAQLGVSGPAAPYAIIMIGMMIAVFGVGYAMVTRDLTGNRGIVWLGVVGKLGTTALATYEYQQGVIPQSTFIAGLGDAVFALLFLLFLFRGPRAAQ